MRSNAKNRIWFIVALPIVINLVTPQSYAMGFENNQRKKWTSQESATLRENVAIFGGKPVEWRMVAKSLPGRSAKQCRERWINQEDPSINHQPITEEEWRHILLERNKHGNNWAKIAESMPTRTPNQIKNKYHSEKNKKRRRKAQLNSYGELDYEAERPKKRPCRRAHDHSIEQGNFGGLHLLREVSYGDWSPQ